MSSNVQLSSTPGESELGNQSSFEGEAAMAAVYHPDPAINAEVALDALDAERADLAAGIPAAPLDLPLRR
jgi:hypothetical protein